MRKPILTAADFEKHAAALGIDTRDPSSQSFHDLRNQYVAAVEAGEESRLAFNKWANGQYDLTHVDSGIDPRFGQDGRRFSAMWRTQRQRLADRYFDRLMEIGDPDIVEDLRRTFLRDVYLTPNWTVRDTTPDLIVLVDSIGIVRDGAMGQVLSEYAAEIDRLLRPEWEKPFEPSDLWRKRIKELVDKGDERGLMRHFQPRIAREAELRRTTFKHLALIRGHLPPADAAEFELRAHHILYGAVYRPLRPPTDDASEPDEAYEKRLTAARERLKELRDAMMTDRAVEQRARTAARRLLGQSPRPDDDPEQAYQEALRAFRDAFRRDR